MNNDNHYNMQFWSSKGSERSVIQGLGLLRELFVKIRVSYDDFQTWQFIGWQYSMLDNPC